MSEIILGLIILAFIAYHAWYVREQNKTLEDYKKAVLAKNLQEYESSKIISKEEPKALHEELPPVMEEQELSDEAFENKIKKQING